MNREQMVELAYLVIGESYAGPGDEPYAAACAQAVLDAILPQVTTELELNALPVGSVVLTPDGDAWTRLDDDGHEWPGWQHLACGPINPKTLTAYGPLTVVWRPEP